MVESANKIPFEKLGSTYVLAVTPNKSSTNFTQNVNPLL